MRLRLRGALTSVLAIGAFLGFWPAPVIAQYLSVKDVLTAEPVAPDLVLAYGRAPEQFGHLRLPEGSGPFPVLVIIHGGCWLSFANLEIMSRFSADLSAAGIATWNIEYRRVDSPGDCSGPARLCRGEIVLRFPPPCPGLPAECLSRRPGFHGPRFPV